MIFVCNASSRSTFIYANNFQQGIQIIMVYVYHQLRTGPSLTFLLLHSELILDIISTGKEDFIVIRQLVDENEPVA